MVMILKLILLMGLSILMSMQAKWIKLNNNLTRAEISGQAIILFLGGLFLLYNSKDLGKS